MQGTPLSPDNCASGTQVALRWTLCKDSAIGLLSPFCVALYWVIEMALWRPFAMACFKPQPPRHLVAALATFHTTSKASVTSAATADGTMGEGTLPLVEEEQYDVIARQDGDSGGSMAKKALRGTSYFPKKGQDVELICEGLAYKGLGVCKVVDTGFVVFCERALPGERLIARIVKKKSGFAEAYKRKTLSVHANAVDAPCRHFGDCGGCKTQNLAYHAQLREKEQQVHELVSRIGRFGFSEADGPNGDYLKPTVPCQNPFHYRNKMEFSFGTQKWTPREELEASDVHESFPQTFALGLHAPKRFDKILPIDECLLQSPVANQILDAVQTYCKTTALKNQAYDAVRHNGFLRHLIIRSGRASDTEDTQIMVNLVTSTYQPDVLQPLVVKLVNAFPQIVSFINNVTSSVGPSSVGQEEYILHGERTITEVLRGLTFQISANSFFQVNTSQAEILYEKVEEGCNLKGDNSETILDLFCGTGTIGLSLAQKAKHVYGIEIVPEAVADARRNAETNGIANATFTQGDLNKLTADFGKDFLPPDVVITDPNRPGMHPKLIRYLLNLRARRIVYVSCNPATLARDLDLLCHGEGTQGQASQVYRLVSVQPVDMFPHTPHVECVAVLELVR